jgi:hypothetical protein
MKNLLKNVVLVAALVASGAAGMWIALRPQLPRGAGFTDGEQLLSATRTRDELRLARWDAPQLLAAHPAFEGARDPELDPASGRVWFTKGEAGSEELWQATLAADGWIVRPLDELNTPARELSPCFHDGWLWFASDRAGGSGGLDLWRAPLAGSRYLAAENVGAPINTDADECDPALRADGELWFASNRGWNGLADFDLMFAAADGRHFCEPRFAESLRSPDQERSPAFAASGRQIVFASDRPGGAGGFDLWRALGDGATFGEPQNLGTPNGPGDESGPALTDDGFTLHFASRRADGTTTLLRTRTRELFAVPAPRFTWTDFSLLAILALVALLAWAARRWETLDLFWKCLVTSLVIHLAFLLWSRRIDVAPVAPVVSEPEAFFELHLSRDALTKVEQPGDRARGESVGEVASGGAGLPVAQALTRGSLLAAPFESAPAPDGGGALVRSELEQETQAGAPQARGRDLAPGPALAPSGGSDPLQPASEGYARLAGGAALPKLAARDAGEAVPATATTALAQFIAGSSGASSLGSLGALEATPSGNAAPAARAPSASSSAAAAPAAAARENAPASLGLAHRGGDPTAPVALAPPTDRAESASGAGDAGDAADGAGRGGGAAPTLALAPAAHDTFGSGGGTASGSGGGGGDRTAARAQLVPFGGGGSGEPTPQKEAPFVATARSGGDGDGDGDAAIGPAHSSAADARGPADGAAGPSVVAMRAPQDGDATAGEASADGSNGSGTGHGSALPLGPSLSPRSGVGAGRGVGATTAALPTRASFGGGGNGLPEIAPTLAATPMALPSPSAAAAAGPEREGDGGAGPPTTPRLYERRFGEAKGVALREGGGSEATERAVLSGLRYLAKAQDPKGFFGDARAVDLHSKYRDVRVGKTALATLAFMGAGHTHRSNGEFSLQVARALSWLISRQDAKSGHFGNSDGYSHGIATYALAECYAMTKDETLVPPLERALDHLLAMQVVGSGDPRKEGGWTYYYPDGPGFDDYPRASISAWQVMALESAKVGGFEVPDESLDAAKRYFLGSFDPTFDGFRYTHNPSWVNGSYGTLPASTPASMFALVLLGEGSHPHVAEAEGYVLERQPSGWRWRGQDAFVRRGQANVYFMYYSTLALFCRGGDAWRAWNRSLQQSLLPAQQRDGSWEEIDLYARDYALDDAEDRAYTTSMCVLMLEVYYRYFTPLLGDRLGK